MAILASAPPVAFVLTRDPAITKAFYRDTLGLVITGEDAFATTFDLAGTMLRLTTVEGWTPGAHTVLGWIVPDIAAAAGELREKGVDFIVYDGFGQDDLGIWSAPDGTAKIAWFNDPEGNNLSLTEFAAA